ncbi:hypothetical protein BLNAU_7695 [Blattamonas nauphoetae]|uniref:Galectin n=1 Tax=Blattamonas nauphoetae TaxID=2049346 RepID=A0ABQ9Y0P9_9EUKA|nr:hypothetical protein BLNAU_7695 [Blattamonas nauphoetae]
MPTLPKIGQTLGINVNRSLNHNYSSSHSKGCSLINLKEGDCVRMEAYLDSTPRTVQFFVNGHHTIPYPALIPSSVRIGCSVWGQGTLFRIDNISRFSQPTPFCH